MAEAAAAAPVERTRARRPQRGGRDAVPAGPGLVAAGRAAVGRSVEDMGAMGGTGAAAPATDPRYRFLSRFGATLLSGGIAAIPMALYHYQAELGLAPQEVWFVGYILAHRWTDALPYPSLRRMSRRTG